MKTDINNRYIINLVLDDDYIDWVCKVICDTINFENKNKS